MDMEIIAAKILPAVFGNTFLLAYNGTKGKNVKWFFYVFYPAHYILFYTIGHTLLQ